MDVLVQQELDERSVPPGQRLRLLSQASGFALLDHSALDRLAALMCEERYDAGACIVNEGERGDKLYLIAEGRAEVSTKSASGTLPLSLLYEGEIFGEIALLSPGGTRQATVTALTPALCLVLHEEDFRLLLDEHRTVKESFQRAADDMLEAKFLKQASPFTKLEPERLRWLSQQIEPLSFAPDETIIRQGEVGDCCYLVRSGRVEVLLKEADAPERRLATMGRGALFGEAALLTDAPRSATVRALEQTELLMLRRDDLLAAMGAERLVLAQMIEFVQLRARPAQASGIISSQRTNADGEIITVLKNPASHTYYRLSSQGWFIWQLLDGRRSLRDLALDYMSAYKSFAPQAIAETIAGLAAAGFVETKQLRADVLEKTIHLAWWQRAVVGARRVLEWQWSIKGIDKTLTRIYRGGVRFFYTRVAQFVLALVTLAGLVAFISMAYKASAAIHSHGGAKFLLFLIPAYLFSILIHEAGHAFTTKAFGYEVPRAGIGWYWFGPIAFVDTSDMWLAGRWPRIAVSLAGPYSNMALAGISAIIAWLSGNATVSAALWLFAAASYVMVLFNFNPLLEYDGYYILADWLERPNLRSRSLAWIGKEMPRAFRSGGGLRGHGLELVYGIAALAYILLMGVLTLVSYRLFLQDYIARLMPPALAASLAWMLGLTVVVLSLAGVVGELRGNK
jgi:CRP-like cAMP-binding protein/Zn-dependent protease